MGDSSCNLQGLVEDVALQLGKAGVKLHSMLSARATTVISALTFTGAMKLFDSTMFYVVICKLIMS